MDSTEVVLPPCIVQQIANPQSHTFNQVPSPMKQSCPWGNISKTETVSFNEVMSEQLATLLEKEDHDIVPPDRLLDTCLAADANFNEATDTCDDFLMAQMLQLEFDREHDYVVKQEEKKYNGASKVSVSFDKYLRLPNVSDSDSDCQELKEEQLEEKAQKHWENFEEAEKVLQAVGKSGVSRQGNSTTTKHDTVMCQRRNTCKLMEFLPGIETGDGCDMRLSNKVYNSLRTHSVSEARRKVHDKKEKATVGKAIDEKTRLILYKLVNSEIVDNINGCFSTGKESCVYHATSQGSEYALKVYKTTLNEFQNRSLYVKDDHRFKDSLGRLNPRKVIHLWAEKEMRNLIRIQRAKIPCPEVIALKKHVLVMSFIGKDSIPAPKLKNIKAPFHDLVHMYEQTVEIMKMMYNDCSLVHADFSEYNLLWYDEKVWVIDVSQSVEVTHPAALEFLFRDCENIYNFFEKQGVPGVLPTKSLFKEICGRDPVQ